MLTSGRSLASAGMSGSFTSPSMGGFSLGGGEWGLALL